MPLQFGIDIVLKNEPNWKMDRIAMLTNDAAITKTGINSRLALKNAGFNLSAKLKYQYQYFIQSMPEFGFNPPFSNFRLKLEAERKIIKKLKVFVSSEPMYRHKASSLYFKRVRNSVGLKWSPIKRTTLEASYIFQPEWNSRNTVQVMQFNITVDLPKKWNRKKESNK
jgi:hypothetical protein